MANLKIVKKTLIVILASVFLGGHNWALNAAETSVADDGAWTLLEAASDEFDGNHLDPEKWTNGIWYDVTSQFAFHPDNVAVEGGNLVLKAKKENYRDKKYTAAAVESKFEVPGTASYVEVRAKVLDKDANVLSAIWLQSSPLNWAMNPNPEIDILETFDFSKMTSTLHSWNQNPTIHLKRKENVFPTGCQDVSDEFHTYGLERRNGKMRFYFDGRLAWEISLSEKSFVELSRHMVLSLEGHLGSPIESRLPGEYLIDYVRTYYYSDFAGVPQDGLYQIVNAHSGMVLSLPQTVGNSSLQLIQRSNEKEAVWSVQKQKDHTWIFQNPKSNNCIDLTADAYVTKDGTAILAYPFHGGPNQKWFIVPTGEGRFKIISALSGKAMCVKDASMENGASIIQWSHSSEDPYTNDEWKLVPIKQ